MFHVLGERSPNNANKNKTRRQLCSTCLDIEFVFKPKTYTFITKYEIKWKKKNRKKSTSVILLRSYSHIAPRCVWFSTMFWSIYEKKIILSVECFIETFLSNRDRHRREHLDSHSHTHSHTHRTLSCENRKLRCVVSCSGAFAFRTSVWASPFIINSHATHQTDWMQKKYFKKTHGFSSKERSNESHCETHFFSLSLSLAVFIHTHHIHPLTPQWNGKFIVYRRKIVSILNTETNACISTVVRRFFVFWIHGYDAFSAEWIEKIEKNIGDSEF